MRLLQIITANIIETSKHFKWFILYKLNKLVLQLLPFYSQKRKTESQLRFKPTAPGCKTQSLKVAGEKIRRKVACCGIPEPDLVAKC